MGRVDEGRVCRSSKNLIKLLSPLVTSLIIPITLPCNPWLCAWKWRKKRRSHNLWRATLDSVLVKRENKLCVNSVGWQSIWKCFRRCCGTDPLPPFLSAANEVAASHWTQRRTHTTVIFHNKFLRVISSVGFLSGHFTKQCRASSCTVPDTVHISIKSHSGGWINEIVQRRMCHDVRHRLPECRV